MKITFDISAILLFFSILTSCDLKMTFAVLICAIAHEFGHILAAKMLKIDLSEIKISAGSAKIYPKGMNFSYISEAVLCAFGPLFNFLCMVLSFLYMILKSGEISFDNSLAGYIFLISIVQIIINILPIQSLDGGRILKAGMSHVFDDKIGNITLNITTFVFAFLLWMVSVYFLIKFGGGISLFAFSLSMMLKIFD